MSRRALINSRSIFSMDTDLFATNASELSRHAEEPIFLVTTVQIKQVEVGS
jgi:hypothetical protein